MMQIKYLVMDVDGTLTDGKIYMGQNGEVMKSFDIKDGYGIRNMIIPARITPVIITGRNSDIVLNRCRELGITEVHQDVSNKFEKLCSIIKNLNHVAYIGDDINDLSCMLAVKDAGGFIGCPADAVEKIRNISDFISSHNGGDGAVRDFIEFILSNMPTVL